MDTYWRAKRALFDWPGLGAAIVNVDDGQGEQLARELSDRPAPALWTCALHRPARLRGKRLRYEAGGLAFDLHEGDAVQPVSSALIGDYNASNLLVVLATLRALGQPLAAAASLVPGLTPVPGRLQRVADAAGEPEVVVDYAHTPDALDKALAALRPLASARGGRLWCVFGCGGNRDASKRPLMGAVASRGADHAVVTSDNPRLEDPQAIVDQVAAGLAGHAEARCIVDRREAIAHAVAGAGPRDVVLVAGKGHEDYQDIGGVKRPFSDVDEARAALSARRVAA